MILVILMLGLLGGLAAPAPAQTGSSPMRSSQPAPAVTFRYLDVRGDSGTHSRSLRVHIEIAPGWHINSDSPLDEFLVPTTVEARADGLRFGKPRFPAPERVHNEALGGEMLLFSGSFEIEIPVDPAPASASKTVPRPAPKAAASPSRTRVTLRYQSCDHATCYPPGETTVER
jgi:hypothetical protein